MEVARFFQKPNTGYHFGDTREELLTQQEQQEQHTPESLGKACGLINGGRGPVGCKPSRIPKRRRDPSD